MGTPNLIFPSRRLTRDKFTSDSEAGNKPQVKGKGAANIGETEAHFYGDVTTTTLDAEVKIVAGGPIRSATYKYSEDGGANYLGRRVYTEWDDGDGGSAGSATDALSITGTGYGDGSEPVVVDSDEDGIPDKLLFVLYSGASEYKVYQCTSFEPGGTWTLLATITTENTINLFAGVSTPAIVQRGKILYLMSCETSTNAGMQFYRSGDYGTTWEPLSMIGGPSGAVGWGSVCVTGSKLLCAVYVVSSGGYMQLRVVTSADGVTWSAAKDISPSASKSYNYPVIVKDYDENIRVYSDCSTDSNVVGRICEDADPAASSATWGAVSESTWSFNANRIHGSIICAPNGDLVVILSDLTGEKHYISRSVYSGTAYGNWGTVTEIMDATSHSNVGRARMGLVGGALWACFRSDVSGTEDTRMMYSCYWMTYAAGRESWMGTAPQYLSDGVWVEWQGGQPMTGDYISVGSAYDYAGYRMCQLDPSRPARSATDEADWNTVIDMGANEVLTVDAVAVWANVEHLHIQANDANSWSSPDKEETISFVYDTVTPDDFYAGYLELAGAGWVPHKFAGWRFTCVTGGNSYLISDNDADRIYVHGTDLSGESGDIKILSPCAWIKFSGGAYTERYWRVHVEDQITPEGYYEIKALVLGRILEGRTRRDKVMPDYAQSIDIYRAPSGRMTRNRLGPARENLELTLNNPTPALYEQLKASLSYLDGPVVPFALAPSSTVATDVRLVIAPPNVNWSRTQTRIRLEECI